LLLRLPMIGPVAVVGGVAPGAFAVLLGLKSHGGIDDAVGALAVLLPRLKSHGGTGDASAHNPRFSCCARASLSSYTAATFAGNSARYAR
jgi:hypothetical protein